MSDLLDDLLGLLRATSEESVGTSVRIPMSLRKAAALAAEMGLTASTTELTVRGLRGQLEALAQQAVLDAHYEQYPHLRPSLAEVAVATAQVDGHPLADRRDLIERAAEEIVRFKRDATPDDVLVYAAGLASAA